jgi:hypothetical protein
VVMQGGIFAGTTGAADPYVVQPGVILQPGGASAVVVQGGI